MEAPRIFLSPSTQPYNKYPNGGDEQYWMNRITDAMIPYLTASGIEYSRNTPDTSVGTSIRDSNSGYYGLHLALHSNAAPPELEGKITGPDVYYYQYSEKGKRAAGIIADNLKKIYPEPGLVDTVPNTTLAELTKTNAPAVLVELAYHDNPQDEVWITNNIEGIARNLAQSVCEYFGVPFRDA